jgi:HAD superfamily hydrolase (TIGR01459 family)
MSRKINALSEIEEQFSALVVDVWGVLCDGTKAHLPARQALVDFRRRGPVVLLSNTARSEADLARFLADKGIGPDCYDWIVTAGQTCFSHMQQSGVLESPIFHIGCPADLDQFAGNTKLELTCEVEKAAAVLCTGLLDETGDFSRECAHLQLARSAELELLCANPDLQVQIGEQSVPCAGQIAAIYESMGGKVSYFGKPHPTVYGCCKKLVREAGLDTETADVLAIGDTIATDVAGAHSAGFKSLFVSNGVAFSATREEAAPNYHMDSLC